MQAVGYSASKEDDQIDEDNLHQLNQSKSLLIEAGFKLDRKDPINKNNKQFNQIWIRGT